MPFTTDLLTGLAVDLDARSIATWRASGQYQAGETAITIATVPQSPDRVVALTAYGVRDDPASSGSIVGVQVRTRWSGQDPRPDQDLADAIFDAWHGWHDVTLTTGVRLVQLLRQSAVSLGQDDNNRWATSQNFYATVDRQSQHRTS